MTPKNVARPIASLLIVLPLLLVAWKFTTNPISVDDLWPKETYPFIPTK